MFTATVNSCYVAAATHKVLREHSPLAADFHNQDVLAKPSYAYGAEMKRLISVRLAGNILLISFGLLMIFHVLVLLHVVPSDIIWGGQIGGSPTNLLTLEMISLIVTVLFAIVIAAKMDYIKAGKLKTAINIGVWVIFAYTILNAVGNLASGVSFENLHWCWHFAR